MKNKKNTKNVLPKNTLTRVHLKELLHNKLALSLEDTSCVLESILSEINRAITRESYLKIFSFGTFLINEKKERVGRNPKTKEEAIISERKSISFRASKELRHLVNRSS